MRNRYEAAGAGDEVPPEFLNNNGSQQASEEEQPEEEVPENDDEEEGNQGADEHQYLSGLKMDDEEGEEDAWKVWKGLISKL